MFPFSRAARVGVQASHLTDGTIKVQRVRISRAIKRPIAVTLFALPLTILLLDTSEHWLPDDYKKVLQKARARPWEDRRHIESRKDGAKSDSRDGLLASFGLSQGEKTAKTPRLSTVFMLPLPIIRQCEPVLYKREDKEWMEALKLTDDTDRVKALKKLVTDETIKAWARDRNTFECMKQMRDEHNKGRIESFLDIVVPLNRPQTFQQQAILFLPSGPQLAWRPLSNTNAQRINRIRNPGVFFQAFWNAGKVFAVASFYQISNHINTARSSSPQSQIGAVGTLISPGVASSSSPKDLDGKGEDRIMSIFHQMTKALVPEGPLAQAKMAFLRTFSALQMQALQQIPEGAVVFQGYVTWVSHRGKLRSTVYAIYLPGQDRLICPIIVERTEILPSARYWHPQAKVHATTLAEKSANWHAALEEIAANLKKHQEAVDKDLISRSTSIEAARRKLAKDIEVFEAKLGGKATPEMKREARVRTNYVVVQGDSMIGIMQQLLSQVESKGASPDQMKELKSLTTRLEKIITVQESSMKSRLSDERVEKKVLPALASEKPVEAKERASRRIRATATSSNEKQLLGQEQDPPFVEVEKEVKEMQPPKQVDGEKPASNTIETITKEKREKG